MTSEAIIYLLAGILLGSGASFAITLAWVKAHIKEAAEMVSSANSAWVAVKYLTKQLDAKHAGTMNTFDAIMLCEPMREADGISFIDRCREAE